MPPKSVFLKIVDFQVKFLGEIFRTIKNGLSIRAKEQRQKIKTLFFFFLVFFNMNYSLKIFRTSVRNIFIKCVRYVFRSSVFNYCVCSSAFSIFYFNLFTFFQVEIFIFLGEIFQVTVKNEFLKISPKSVFLKIVDFQVKFLGL